MQLTLEIKTGRLAGRVVPVPEGKATTVGRTPRSDLAIPQDTFLSGIHFALESNGAKCKVVDRKSANGTFLNGTRVSEAIVHDGDEIMAGKTLFLVRMVDTKEESSPPAIPSAISADIPPPIPIVTVEPALPSRLPSERFPPLEPPPVAPAPSRPPLTPPALTPPALTLGSWRFGRIPEGWVVDEGYGFHFAEPGAFPSEAVVSETRLAGDVSLPNHIESEMVLVREFVSEPEIKMAGEFSVAGAEEARGVVIRYKTDDGRRFWQRQVYARSGRLVGVLMLTTLEQELPRIQPVFDAIVSASVFREAADSV